MGHGFQAGDFEFEGFDFLGVAAAADCADYFGHEAFGGGFVDFSLESAETTAFYDEHFVGGV